MAGNDGTNTLAVVASPPAEPPLVGLIPSLPSAYLIDDTGATVDERSPDAAAPEARYPAPSGLNRWELGFQYSPEQTCHQGYTVDPCNPGTLTIPANPDAVKAMPYLIGTGDKCSTFGWSARDFQARATRALLAVESFQIASELWTGHRGVIAGWPNAYLASTASDVLSNGALSPANALGCLEQGLAQCSDGQRGMIHCTRQLAMMWAELGSVYRVGSAAGNVIMTHMGTIIVPDAGYDGSSPSGSPAVSGSQWAYATLMVTVRRSPIEVVPDTLAEAMTRSTNLIEWRAERIAVATFPSCCLLAVEVNVPLCLVGGVS